MSSSIYETDFSAYIPTALQHDPKMVALAKTVSDQLKEASGQIKNVLIYSRIDELPEELVDVLAYDLHVDWYDYSYPIEAKRDLVKNSVKVHKKMGTKFAIENAVRSLHPNSVLEEWFEYGGNPGNFNIILNISDSRVEVSLKKISDTVKFYKRLSAKLEVIDYLYKKTVGNTVDVVNRYGNSITVYGRREEID
jgi:phage tail P2-like protein